MFGSENKSMIHLTKYDLPPDLLQYRRENSTEYFEVSIVVVIIKHTCLYLLLNRNILRYSLFGIAGGQEVDHTFVKFIIYPLNNDCKLIVS